MNAIYRAAIEAQTFLRKQGWPYCIIGGLAVIRWGNPRATQDVDISLLTELGREEDYIERLLMAFAPRIDEAGEFAQQSRVLLLSATNGVPLDIALAAFPFEELVISRASEFKFARGVSLRTAAAEDLVVLKAFAGRPQDWIDVEGIVIRQGATLDWHYIEEHLESLNELKPDFAAPDRLRELRQRLS